MYHVFLLISCDTTKIQKHRFINIKPLTMSFNRAWQKILFQEKSGIKMKKD